MIPWSCRQLGSKCFIGRRKYCGLLQLCTKTNLFICARKNSDSVFHPHADGWHQKTLLCFDIRHNHSQHQAKVKKPSLLMCLRRWFYLKHHFAWLFSTLIIISAVSTQSSTSYVYNSSLSQSCLTSTNTWSVRHWGILLLFSLFYLFTFWLSI